MSTAATRWRMQQQLKEIGQTTRHYVHHFRDRLVRNWNDHVLLSTYVEHDIQAHTVITQYWVLYYVLALCLYCFYSLFSFLVMFYSYYGLRLSHLNKDYLLTYYFFGQWWCATMWNLRAATNSNTFSWNVPAFKLFVKSTSWAASLRSSLTVSTIRVSLMLLIFTVTVVISVLYLAW